MKMKPRITSEVSGRLTGLDPSVRAFFSLPTVTLSGKDIEELACAVWMVGYGNAIADVMDLPGEQPDYTPLMEMWGWDAD